MKSIFGWTTLSVLIAGILAFNVSWAGESEVMTAKSILQESFKRYGKNVKYEAELVVINDEDMQSTAIRWICHKGACSNEQVMVSIQNTILRGRAVLILRDEDGKDTVVYRPFEGEEFTSFVGSESTPFFGLLTLRDLVQTVRERFSGYTYSFADHVALKEAGLHRKEGEKWAITAQARPETQKVYNRRIFFVDQNFVVTRVWYASPEGNKILINKEIVWDDGRWRVNLIIFKDLSTGVQTVITVKDRKFLKNGPPFTQGTLEEMYQWQW